MPSIFAGIVVNAASTSSAERPRARAFRTRSARSASSGRPCVVRANVIPASRSQRATRRRTVPVPEARQRDVHPVVVVVHGRRGREVERQDDLRRERLHLVHQEPGVAASDVFSASGRTLRRASRRGGARGRLRRLEEDRFASGHDVAEGRPRLDPVGSPKRRLRLRTPPRRRETSGRRRTSAGRRPRPPSSTTGTRQFRRRPGASSETISAVFGDDEVRETGPSPSDEDGALPAEDPGVRDRLDDREARLAESRNRLGIHLDLRRGPSLRRRRATSGWTLPAGSGSGRRRSGSAVRAPVRRVVVRRPLLLSGEPAECHVRVDQPRIDRLSGEVEYGRRPAGRRRRQRRRPPRRPRRGRRSSPSRSPSRSRDDLRVHEREDARKLGGGGDGSEGREGEGGGQHRHAGAILVTKLTSRLRSSR